MKYSPFFDNRIAVASAANFGLVGNGRLHVLSLTPKGIVAEKWYLYPDVNILLELTFAKVRYPRFSL